MGNNLNYTATQKENGFYVEFEDSKKSPVEITFDDFDIFAKAYNQSLLSGKKPKLSEIDKIMLSLWGMYMIPDNTIH